MSTPQAQPTNPPSQAPPIQFILKPLILSNPATSQKKNSTKVVLPGTEGGAGGKLTAALNSGDVLVLGLKRVATAGVGGEAKPANTCGGGCACGPSADMKDDVKDDKKSAEEKEDEREKKAAKGKVNTDLAPLGGTYELTLEPVTSETHDMVRVVGAVFRKSGEDKILLQLLTEPISHCKIFLLSQAVNSTGTSSEQSKGQHKPTLLGRVHEIFGKSKDENGLKPDNEGWGRIPDGFALNVSPSVNNVREGGTDLKLEITFKSSHPHDVHSAFDTIKEIISGKHHDPKPNPSQGTTHDTKTPTPAAKEKGDCKCNEGTNCAATGCKCGCITGEKDEEVVSVGLHVVTGA